MRPAFFVPVVLFIALVVFFVVALNDEAPDELPSTLIGQEIRPFDLPSLFEGPDSGFPAYRVADADLKDGTVTVVNFWASWCGPCRLEHPLLLGLKQKGVRLLGMNYKDDVADARLFLENLGNPYGQVASDNAGRVGIDWGITGVPETFVVDGEGRVIARHVGPLTAMDLEDVIAPALVEAVR